MGWIDGEVDGVAIKVRSIVGSAEFCAAFEQFMEYELMGLADRENMSTGFGDPFNDTSDVTLSNAYLESGGLRNTVIAAVPAQSGGALIPTLTSNDGDVNWSVDASYSNYSGNFGYYYPWRMFHPTACIGDGDRWISAQNGDKYENHWVSMYNKQGAFTFASVSLSCYDRASCNEEWYKFDVEITQDGNNWTSVQSFTATNWTDKIAQKFVLYNPQSCRGVRIVSKELTADNPYAAIRGWSVQLYSPDIPYKSAEVNPATVTLDSYVLTETLEAVKVKLWLEDLDNTGAISCGNTGSDKIEAYLSYDGNSTFTSALSFLTDDIKATYSGSNIYIFTSEEIDVSAEEITGLGLKVQSFARSVAPNFKLHGALVVGRPVTEE